jgi:CRISP-associated protein Cas1
MFIDHSIISNCESGEWAFRSENWISDAAKIDKKRKRRERNAWPLILCGHGISLKIDKGCLVIREGFTHYPQEQTKYRFFRGDLELPPRILLLDGSGTLSFDVLTWLSQQGVVLVRICWNGNIATVATGSGFAADRAKVNWQHETRIDNAKRLAFAIDLISKKLTNSLSTL